MSGLLDDGGALDELVDGLVHLLACADCWIQFRKLYPEQSRSLFLECFGIEEQPSGISPPLLRENLETVLQDVRESGRKLRELLSHPPMRRPLVVRNCRRFQTIGLVNQLLEEARFTWDDQPAEALELVELALLVLRALPRTVCRVSRLNDLMARAFAYRGNCHRIVSRLRVASRDFQRARIYLDQGRGWPRERAVIDGLEASLCRDQCHFEDGAKLARRARRFYEGAGDVEGEARLVILEAMNLRAAGYPEAACRELEHLLASFEPEEMSWQHTLTAKHNLVTYLTDLDRIEEVRELLPEVYRLHERFGDRSKWIRLCWLEAMILERVGEVEAAVEQYLEVRDHFVEENISYEVALVSLDLTALYLDSGRTREAKGLAAGLVPLFETHEIHREASLALALFCQAVEQENATVALAHDVADFLKRARGRPDLRYEPPPQLP